MSTGYLSHPPYHSYLRRCHSVYGRHGFPFKRPGATGCNSVTRGAAFWSGMLVRISILIWPWVERRRRVIRRGLWRPPRDSTVEKRAVNMYEVLGGGAGAARGLRTPSPTPAPEGVERLRWVVVAGMMTMSGMTPGSGLSCWNSMRQTRVWGWGMRRCGGRLILQIWFWRYRDSWMRREWRLRCLRMSVRHWQ